MGSPGFETARSSSAPETSSSAPVSSTPEVDGSNADALDGAGLGAPVCVAGIEGLRNAIDASDPNDAWSLFNTLSASDIVVLRNDSILQQGLLGLVTSEEAAVVLWALQHPIDLWLELAATYCAQEAVLARVLDDAGILTAADIATWAEVLAALPAFQTQALFDAIIDGSTAADQATLLGSEAGSALVRLIYGMSPLVIFTELASDSQLVLDLYLGIESVRTWLLEDVAELNNHILTIWLTSAEWLCALALVYPDDITSLIDDDQGGWGLGLGESLMRGGGDAATVLAPPSDLTSLVMWAIAMVSPVTAAEVCDLLAFPTRESLLMAQTDGWLNLDSAQSLLLGSPIADQVAVANDGVLVGALSPLAWIEDFLVEFVADQAQFAAAYSAVPELRAWMEMDRDFFGALITDPSVWVDAFIAGGEVGPMLKFAAADPAAWRVNVDDSKLTAILGLMQKPCAEEDAAGLWALFLDSNRGVDVGLETFYTLFGMRIWTSANQPERAFTDIASSTGVVFERKQIWQTVDPSQQALNDYMKMLVTLPRGQVSTCAVGFGKGWNMHFKRKTPPADAAFDATIGPQFGDAGTSMYWGDGVNFMLMYTNSAGGIDVEDNGNAHWISGPQRVASDGNATGVGGTGTTTDATTGVVTPTASNTDAALSYFENHAVHEHGHGVGNRAYAGMTMQKGDLSAKKWSKWRDSSAAQMRGAYFAGAGGDVTDVVDTTGAAQTVAASEIGLWLTTVLSTGSEPTASASAGTGGLMTGLFAGSMMDHLSGIRASSVASKDLFKYVNSVANSNNPSNIPGGAYEYPGFTPGTGTAYIYCNAQEGFRKYDKGVMTELTASHGWYSLASHTEMFAEIYTKRYATSSHDIPGTRNGVNWETFFNQLEASPDSALQAGVPPTVAGIGGAPGPTPAPAPAPVPAPVPGGASPMPGASAVEITAAELTRMTSDGIGSPI